MTALVLIAATGAFYQYLRFKLEHTQDALKSAELYQRASNLFFGGNYENAAAEARDIASKTTDPSTKRSALGLVANSSFMTGDTNTQVEAVKRMKQQYEQDTNPVQKAQDINTMLEFLSTSRDVSVFNEVFSGPFASYKTEDDISASIGRLAKYSYSLYPTTTALFQSAYPHFSPLINFDKDHTLTSGERKLHADALLPILKEAETLWPQEFIRKSKDDVLATSRFYYWEGVLYGAVARVYPIYLHNAEESFQKVSDYYDEYNTEHPDSSVLVASRVPMALATSAFTIYEVQGEKRRADIEKLLAKVIALVDAHPDYYQNQFIPLIQRAAKGSTVSQTSETLRRLAIFYPPFEEFLRRYGFDIKKN